jgi:glycosyltransferase involved in cell wall biosynthesis
MRPAPILLMVRELGGGGTERQTAEVAKALDRTRFAPHVGCFRANGIRWEELRAAGIPVVEFPVRSFTSPRTLGVLKKFGSYLREYRIQIVHTFDVPANLFGVFGARLFRTPIVISSQRAYRSLTPGVTHSLLRITDRLVDAVVVNSDVLRRQLMAEDRVPEHLLALCRNGLDLNALRPEGESMRHVLGSPDLVIGAVSMLRPEKGFSTLVEAFARLRPNAKLVLVGDGPSRAELEAQAQKLGVEAYFAGAVARVAPWLRAIDIFVLPSHSEALSNSLMEAMAIGCVPVASNVGGNPELVEDGVNGFLFEKGNVMELADRLERLIESPPLRNRFAKTSRERMQSRHALSTSVRCFESLYDRLLISKGHI